MLVTVNTYLSCWQPFLFGRFCWLSELRGWSLIARKIWHLCAEELLLILRVEMLSIRVLDLLIHVSYN